MIDLHFHVLPRIDDGPKTLEGSIALARAAKDAGVQILVATPHVSPRYPNDAETIVRLVDELNARLAAECVKVDVHAGAEIAIAQIPEIAPAQFAGLTLGQGRWLLVEPPFSPTAPTLSTVVADLQRLGYGVVLAHPERCPAFHRDPAMLESLVRAGALTSVTAGALVGRFGSDVRNFALDLAGAEMLHNVASDAHDRDRRPPGMVRELKRAGLARLAEWLTHEVPAAILNDEEIPRRPAVTSAGTGKTWRALWRRRDDSLRRVSRWPQSPS